MPALSVVEGSKGTAEVTARRTVAALWPRRRKENLVAQAPDSAELVAGPPVIGGKNLSLRATEGSVAIQIAASQKLLAMTIFLENYKHLTGLL